MLIFSYSLAAALCIVLGLLIMAGKKLRLKSFQEVKHLEQDSVLRWPSLALIVPVGGNDPRTVKALSSLMTQDYPNYIPVLVTATSSEPAAKLIANLKATYPQIQHVVAGQALNCGQKNHNLLRGIAAVDRLKPDCYAFCDSTHLAKPNFLRALVQPIARLETRFSTGYHEVVAKDQSLTSLGYAISVLFMRHLQALSVFTQPWGGAMAITRSTFIKAKIGERWSNTVVDDCSLVSYLKEKHIHVELAASALLKTEVENYQPPVWQAWMERQILFPRFCVPLQWWLLGVMLMLMLMPPLLIFEDLVLVLKQGHLLRALLPCGFFVLYFGLIWRLSSYLAWSCSKLKFIGGFFLALWTFLREYIGTFWSQNIYWQGILYKVGRGGIVLESHKIDE